MTPLPIGPQIASLAYNAARRFGSSTAFVFPNIRTLTFVEIDDLAGRFAGALRKNGVKPGDRVVLHVPNSWEWIVAYHAVARLGAVFIPANILLSAVEVSYMVEDSGAKVLIVPPDRTTTIAVPSDVLVIATGDAGSGASFNQMLTEAYVEPVEVSPADLFTIGYTSGTTGKPKGAMLSHSAVFASLAATATLHVRHPTDVVLTALPFPHVYGNIVMNSAFLVGLKIVAMARFDVSEVMRLISDEHVTLFEGVPTMYYQMLAHPKIASANFSSLTRCTVGGQTMPSAKIDEVIERFGCPMLELWGMTELAGPAVTHSPYWPPRNGSIGLAAPGMEVRVAALDDTSKNAPRGEAGELMVRGAMVMTGYWKNEAATRETIDADGWLATGDIARADDDGYLYVIDRKKDLIITAGYNIYPAELEQVIAMHPGVAMVAVTSVTDEEKGELAKAYVVRHAGATLDDKELLAHCRVHLAPYKVPRVVAFVDKLPTTSTGKILRRELRERPPEQSKGNT